MISGWPAYLCEVVQQGVVGLFLKIARRQVQAVLLDVQMFSRGAVVGDEPDGGVVRGTDLPSLQLVTPGGHRGRNEQRDSWLTWRQE